MALDGFRQRGMRGMRKRGLLVKTLEKRYKN
ncbi:MAG: hypothetical protein FD151_996 [bacterium]|nr:MAG: hypothetical protein FD151_996 [bacterium]